MIRQIRDWNIYGQPFPECRKSFQCERKSFSRQSDAYFDPKKKSEETNENVVQKVVNKICKNKKNRFSDEWTNIKYGMFLIGFRSLSYM